MCMRRKSNRFGYTFSFVGGGTLPATIVLPISLHVKYISCVLEVSEGYYSSVSFLVHWDSTISHARIHTHTLLYTVASLDPM